MKTILSIVAMTLILSYALAIYTVPPDRRMMVSALALSLAFGLALLTRRNHEGGSKG